MGFMAYIREPVIAQVWGPLWSTASIIHAGFPVRRWCVFWLRARCSRGVRHGFNRCDQPLFPFSASDAAKAVNQTFQVTFQSEATRTAASGFKGASLTSEWSTSTVTSGYRLLRNIRGLWQKASVGIIPAAHEHISLSIKKSIFKRLLDCLFHSNMHFYGYFRPPAVQEKKKKKVYSWLRAIQDHSFQVLVH